jgi:hypothetical protein
MATAWLDHYVDAWLLHPVAGTPDGAAELRGLLACFAPKARYEDVPSGAVFEGHDGVAEMCKLAHQWSSDFTATILSRQAAGGHFAFEWETTGTNTGAMGDMAPTGKAFRLRGVSVGEIDDEHLVTSQRDYWDLAAFLMQIGVLPSPT